MLWWSAMIRSFNTHFCCMSLQKKKCPDWPYPQYKSMWSAGQTWNLMAPVKIRKMLLVFPWYEKLNIILSNVHILHFRCSFLPLCWNSGLSASFVQNLECVTIENRNEMEWGSGQFFENYIGFGQKIEAKFGGQSEPPILFGFLSFELFFQRPLKDFGWMVNQCPPSKVQPFRYFFIFIKRKGLREKRIQ